MSPSPPSPSSPYVRAAAAVKAFACPPLSLASSSPPLVPSPAVAEARVPRALVAAPPRRRLQRGDAARGAARGAPSCSAPPPRPSSMPDDDPPPTPQQQQPLRSRRERPLHHASPPAAAAAGAAAVPPPDDRAPRRRTRAPRHAASSPTSSAAAASTRPESHTPPVAGASPSSSPSSSNPQHSLANLHELTERIADLLHVGSIHHNHLHSPKDAPLGYLHATTHVVIIFGKHLIRDQITVEYAKRIVTFIKQIASRALQPDVVVFTGGRGSHSPSALSEAVAGYAFFRAMCEEVNLDVSRFDFILEEQSRNTKENLNNVIDELRRRSGPDALASCHFTLVSSDYHLIRIQEVHRLSPRQSVLFPLDVSSATWNCIFAAYPFCVSHDPATAFLGRAVVLANDLGILLVNLTGAIDDREFVATENLHRLNETFAKMREMYRVIDARSSSPGGFRTDMRMYAETLELAIHNVRQAQTLLSPLQQDGASIPRAHLQLARDLLLAAIVDMRSSMDPDRVLRVHDRLAIVDDMLAFAASGAASQSKGLSPGPSPPVSLADSLGDVAWDGGSGVNDVADVDGTVASDLDAAGETGRGRRQRSAGPKASLAGANEVTWGKGVIFEGNGKKISRDGPNLVITDSSAPPVPATPGRRRGSRRTTADSDSLAGALASSLVSSNQSAVPSGRSSRHVESAGQSRRGAAPRKPRQQGSGVKKRKTTARKLAAPSTGEVQ